VPAPVSEPVPPAPEPVVPAPVTVALPAFDLVSLARATFAFPAAAPTAAPMTLPAPSDIPAGDPTSPAPPPGLVPAGDSRSLRRADEFALVYRHQAAVITRKGMIGQRGFWRVTGYPSPTQAAAAYAAECSRLLGIGFADLVG
jgi:hypothetical protein